MPVHQWPANVLVNKCLHGTQSSENLYLPSPGEKRREMGRGCSRCRKRECHMHRFVNSRNVHLFNTRNRYSSGVCKSTRERLYTPELYSIIYNCNGGRSSSGSCISSHVPRWRGNYRYLKAHHQTFVSLLTNRLWFSAFTLWSSTFVGWRLNGICTVVCCRGGMHACHFGSCCYGLVHPRFRPSNVKGIQSLMGSG